MSNESYTIHFSYDADVLKVVISGTLVTEKTTNMKGEAKNIAQTIYGAFEQYKPEKVLIDCTRLIGRLGVTETYFHVREIKPSQHHPARVAVMDIPENKEYFLFHETVGANSGLTSRFFGDQIDALQWLKE